MPSGISRSFPSGTEPPLGGPDPLAQYKTYDTVAARITLSTTPAYQQLRLALPAPCWRWCWPCGNWSFGLHHQATACPTRNLFRAPTCSVDHSKIANWDDDPKQQARNHSKTANWEDAPKQQIRKAPGCEPPSWWLCSGRPRSP